MTAALSMTTGLLMSYRSSSALAKWGKGKAAWGGIKGEVRDVLRQVRIWRSKYRS
jgi:predicted membrane chloride channel (bestrophin family)